MRHIATFLCGATLMFGGLVFAAPPTTEPAATTPEELVKTQLEVDALRKISDLKLSADQLKKLREMTENPAGDLPSASGDVDPDYDAALKSLHDAILSGDEGAIKAAKDRVSKLEYKLDIDRPSPDLTDAASKRANEALQLLTPHQLAGYIAWNADEIVDCHALLSDALGKCQDLSKDKFIALRDRVADEISSLLVFTAPGNPKPPIYQKIVKLMDHVRGMSHGGFQSQQIAIDDEISDLLSKLGPVRGIKNWTVREMAELLANPELHHAIDEYQKTVAAK